MSPKPHYEYERRFLVSDLSVFLGSEYERIIQAYAFENVGYTSRVRLVQEERHGRWVTKKATAGLKGPRVSGRRREDESEFADLELAEQVVARSPHKVVKLRHAANVDSDLWVFDVFEGENQGLVIAEIEGEQEIFTKSHPSWAGREVTTEDLYNNEMLAIYPMQTRNRTDSPYRAMLRRLAERQDLEDDDFQ